MSKIIFTFETNASYVFGNFIQYTQYNNEDNKYEQVNYFTCLVILLLPYLILLFF